MSNFHELSATRIDGSEASMREYQGKVVLIVNTASQCGFTPQYEGLEKLQREYGERGLVILGFPCNQFGAQEPGDDAEIARFCSLNYDVTFPMFARIEVNGAKTHPIYQFLKSQKSGLFGTEGIKWNFTKFLLDKEGKVVDRYAPTTKPEELAKTIESLL